MLLRSLSLCLDPTLGVVVERLYHHSKMWSSHDQSAGCLSNPTTIDQSTTPWLIVATQWFEQHCSDPRWSHVHPLQTPRKLNFQQLTPVGSSHTQKFLVRVCWWWRRRCSHLWECLKWLGRSHLTNRCRDNYRFIEGVNSLQKKCNLLASSVNKIFHWPNIHAGILCTFWLHIKQLSIWYVRPTEEHFIGAPRYDLQSP